MKKIFQKQLEELGFMRCPHCGIYTPHYIDTYNTQKTFLGFPVSSPEKGFVLRCGQCLKQSLLTREQVHTHIQNVSKSISYKQQLKIWKLIYTSHKYQSADEELSKDLGPFFESVKKDARSNVPFDVSDKDFDYIFNAYLTNLTKSTKK